MNALLALSSQHMNTVRAPLEAAGMAFTRIAEWRGVVGHIKQDCEFLALSLELLLKEDLRTQLLARGMLSNFSGIKVLFYTTAEIPELTKLRSFVAFDGEFLMPDDEASVAGVLNELLSDSPLLFNRAASGPVHKTPSRARVGWDEEAAFVGSIGTPRVVVTMPGLSRGSLKRLTVPRLLYLLSVQQRSGELIITHGSLECTVSFWKGALIDTGELRGGARDLQATFAWKDGYYRFLDGDKVSGDEVDLLRYIADGLHEFVPFNELAGRLAEHAEHYPAFTTLLELKEVAQSVETAAAVALACTGQQQLKALSTDTAHSVHSLLESLALMTCIDAVVFFDVPMKTPVGVSYALREVTTEDLIEIDAPLTLPKGRASQRRRMPASTMQKIAKLDEAGQALLQKLKRLRDTFAQSDPYVVLGVIPGCGTNEVHAAYFKHLATHRSEVYSKYEHTPVKVLAELVLGTIKNAYQLVLSQESERRVRGNTQDLVPSDRES